MRRGARRLEQRNGPCRRCQRRPQGCVRKDPGAAGRLASATEEGYVQQSSKDERASAWVTIAILCRCASISMEIVSVGNLPQPCLHPVGHWFGVSNLLRHRGAACMDAPCDWTRDDRRANRKNAALLFRTEGHTPPCDGRPRPSKLLSTRSQVSFDHVGWTFLSVVRPMTDRNVQPTLSTLSSLTLDGVEPVQMSLDLVQRHSLRQGCP